MLRLLSALACAAFSAGCTLPSAQLAFPGPPTSSIPGSPIGNASQRNGVPLSNPPAEETQGSRVFQGSGKFTNLANAAGDGTQLAGLPGPASSETAEGVSLNLQGASIAEAAKAVLGDVLQANYVVSDKVKGSITLKTSKPIPKADLAGVFESILKSEGATLLNDNGLYKIVPSEDASQTGAPLRSRRTANGGPGTRTEVVPLRYVSATEMERILRSVAPQSGILRVDTSRNLLILSGTQNELQSMIETVGVFDVDWMRGMSFAIFPIETSDPEAIAQELDTVFANDRESPTKGVIRFVPNRRLKSVLVMSSRPEYIAKAEKWLQRIDLASKATEKQVHVYHVQNRPATELAQLLQKVYTPQPGGINQPTSFAQNGVAPIATAAAPITDEFGTPAPPSVTGPGGGQIFQPITPVPAPPSPLVGLSGAAGQAAPATSTDPGLAAGTPGAATPVQSTLPPDDRATGITVVPDESNNSLIITATSTEFKRVKQILSRIDLPPNQVLLETTIAEVTLNDRLRFGLRWFFEKGASEVGLTDATALAAAAAGTGFGPVFPGFSYFLNTPNVQVALNALNAVTEVNVVSSPSLMVLDNKKAIMQVGDEVPVATAQQQAIIGGGAPIVNAISFRNTGVILSITPRVSDNGRVLLEVEQEVSDVVETADETITPTIQQRRVKTTVAVDDGETLILAGLMQDRNTVTNQKVPLIGDIPYLGTLFKNKDNTIERTELLIAITPRVVKDPNEARGIAAEFRDRINLTTRPQRDGPPDRRENFERAIVR